MPKKRPSHSEQTTVGLPTETEGTKGILAWVLQEGDTSQDELPWEAWRKVRIVRSHEAAAQ
jgi:hypothetical protein